MLVGGTVVAADIIKVGAAVDRMTVEREEMEGANEGAEEDMLYSVVVEAEVICVVVGDVVIKLGVGAGCGAVVGDIVVLEFAVVAG